MAPPPRWTLSPLVRGVRSLISSSHMTAAPVVDFATPQRRHRAVLRRVRGRCTPAVGTLGVASPLTDISCMLPSPPNQDEQHGRREEMHSAAATYCRTKASNTGAARRSIAPPRPTVVPRQATQEWGGGAQRRRGLLSYQGKQHGSGKEEHSAAAAYFRTVVVCNIARAPFVSCLDRIFC